MIALQIKVIAKMKTILLVWNYNRPDWIQPFISLKDNFRFVFLSKFYKEEEIATAKALNIPIIYWTDFGSAGAILDKVKPDVILFMSVINFTDIILNYTAQKRKIRTVILQHGLFFDQKTYKENVRSLRERNALVKGRVFVRKRLMQWKIRYIISAVFQGFGFYSTIRLLQYLYDKSRTTDIEALERNRFIEREPNFLLVFTLHNAAVYHERDGLPYNKMKAIGNPFIDAHFQEHTNRKLPFENFILLIDTILYLENSPKKGFGFSKSDAVDVYIKILQYAKVRGKHLVIKLHPFAYNQRPILDDPSVTYIKGEFEATELIKKADSIISFPSTLILPALYYKPVLILNFMKNDFIELLKETKIARVVELNDFSPDIEDPFHNNFVQQWVEEKFLLKADGRSVERLKESLQAI